MCILPGGQTSNPESFLLQDPVKKEDEHLLIKNPPTYLLASLISLLVLPGSKTVEETIRLSWTSKDTSYQAPS